METLNFWVYWAVYVLYFAIIFLSIAVVLKENRNPIRSLSWVIALIFLPVVGFIFYLFFGRSMRGQHMISRMNKRKIITTMAPAISISIRSRSAGRNAI